ncbi:MAG TPA: BACON domain-containing carbohydrate-binding protein, partial [Pyrinomonadaceae bacterium]
MKPQILTRAIRYTLLLSALSLLLCAGARAQGTNFKTMKAPGGVAIDRNGNVWVSYLILDGSGVYISEYSAAGTFIRTVTLTGYWPVTIETEPTTGYIWGVESAGRVIKINPTTGAAAGLFNLRTISTDFCHIFDAASGSVDCFGGLISPGSATYGDLAFWVNPLDNSRYLFVSGVSTAFPFVTRVKLTNDTPSGARVLASSRASASPYSNVTRGVGVAYNGFVMTTLPLGAVGGTYDRIHVFDALFDLGNGPYPTPLSDDFVDSRGLTADARGGFYISTSASGSVLCPNGGGNVVYITPDLSSYSCYSLGRLTASSEDVGVSNLGNAIYVAVVNEDRVVRFTTPDLCSFSIFPGGDDFTSAAGTGSIDVETDGACPWQAASNATWITITSGSSGAGFGTVSYNVAANTSTAARTGTLTVAGETYTVTQAGAPCTYTLGATSRNVTAAATTGTVTVTALAGCTWTAVSNNTGWLNVTAGASGSGNGTVSYSVTANTGPARTGTITIAGQTFTVTQDSGCTYTISPTSLNFVAAGGSASITVTPGNAACPWTAVSNVTWVSVNSGAT